MSVTPFFLSERSQQIRAATVTATLCVLSFFFSYCIVFEYNYAMLMPVLPVLLWLWRQERAPWLRRLLMGLLVVSFAVFLPTPILLDPQHPNRFWMHGAVVRVLSVLVVFLGLFAYGIVFSWRAWRGRTPAVGRTPHGVWAVLCLGGALGALLGAVLAAAYLTVPRRMRISPHEWTSKDWITHLEDVLSRPGIAPAIGADIHQALCAVLRPDSTARHPRTFAQGDSRGGRFGALPLHAGRHLFCARSVRRSDRASPKGIGARSAICGSPQQFGHRLGGPGSNGRRD